MQLIAPVPAPDRLEIRLSLPVRCLLEAFRFVVGRMWFRITKLLQNLHQTAGKQQKDKGFCFVKKDFHKMATKELPPRCAESSKEGSFLSRPQDPLSGRAK